MAKGDRKDGILLRNLDSLHFITGIIYPNRCDNEVFFSEIVDLSIVDKYLEKKNVNEDYKYNFFQIIVTAIVKTITLRPCLNRFIVNGNFYQRKYISASFVVKKIFSDSGSEALAWIRFDDEDNINTVHQKIYKEISTQRSDKIDESTEAMDVFNKLPRFLSKSIVHFIMRLDKHGLVPQSLIASDPYYSSVVLTNLGSLKMHGGYHHLTNWGTCSIFTIIGLIQKRSIVNPDGTTEMKDTVDIGLTLDERIADGYYFAKSVRLLKYMLEHPETLEENMNIMPEGFVKEEENKK